MREIKFRFVFKHPESGQTIISRSYTIDELVAQDDVYTTYNIQDECCVCDCQPEGETNVIECNCSDYYDKFEPIDRIEWSGLRDKNGVEIYEGDILTGIFTVNGDDEKRGHNYFNTYKDIITTVLIEYDEKQSAFIASCEQKNEYKTSFFRGGTSRHQRALNEYTKISSSIKVPVSVLNRFEVISNRFQNPELLNAKS